MSGSTPQTDSRQRRRGHAILEEIIAALGRVRPSMERHDNMQMAELRKDALGFLHALALGVAGAAPSFSISATMSTLIASVGVLAPASLLYCGLMMFGITVAYAKLNSVRASAGAAYAWVGEIFSPVWGFFSGWAVLCSSALFMVSATVPAGAATLLIFKPELAGDKVAVTLVSLVWLALVSLGVLKGALFSGRAMMITASFELVTLLVLGIATLISGTSGASLGWHDFSPFAFTLPAFAGGAVIAVFFYWGWDVALNFSEETRDSARNPGLGALAASVLLLLAFVGAAATSVMALTPDEVAAAGTTILFAVARKVLPDPWGYVAVLALILSTIGTLQTSIAQFARMMFAKSRDGVLPPRWGQLHPKWQTPQAAILLIFGLGAALLILSLLSESLAATMQASINAIGAQAAFYYGLAGIACAWACVRSGGHSTRDWLVLVLWPLVSALTLLGAAVITLSQADWITNLFAIGGIGLGAIPWWLWGRSPSPVPAES